MTTNECLSPKMFENEKAELQCNELDAKRRHICLTSNVKRYPLAHVMDVHHTMASLAHELRDPTREELYTTGPQRELPAEIQEMAVEDTACTFCGVSYFVFAEVQELQVAVKKYKVTFRVRLLACLFDRLQWVDASTVSSNKTHAH